MHALNYTYEILDYYESKDDVETTERLKENIEIYIEDLGGKDEAKRQLEQLPQPYRNEPLEKFPHYNELCSGKSVNVS